jgi:hypothetical protein
MPTRGLLGTRPLIHCLTYGYWLAEAMRILNQCLSTSSETTPGAMVRQSFLTLPNPSTITIKPVRVMRLSAGSNCQLPVAVAGGWLSMVTR